MADNNEGTSLEKKNSSIFEDEERPGNKFYFKHKYMWKTKEIASTIFFALLCLGSLAAELITGNINFFILTALGFIMFWYSLYLGKSYKKKSEVTAIFDDGTMSLSVDGGGFTGINNNIDIRNIDQISLKKKGSRENPLSHRDLMVFRDTRTSKVLNLPIRLFSEDDLSRLLAPIINKYGNESIQEAVKLGEDYEG